LVARSKGNTLTYLATLTFDLQNADSADYECVAKRLAKIGLEPQLKGDSGAMVDLPANTFAGEYLSNDRDALFAKIEAIFHACKVSGPVFLTTAGKWGWLAGNF